MSSAKKINPDHDSPSEGLPQTPNESLLRLVAMEPTSELPTTPRVKITREKRVRNIFLVAGILFAVFVITAGAVAGVLYMIMTGYIDIQPADIKRFLKALTFK